MILRTVNQVKDASNADLLETYIAMTGKEIKKFSSRGAAESQTSNAILSGINRRSSFGLPRGTHPKDIQAMTTEEAKAAQAATDTNAAKAATDNPAAPEAEAPKAKKEKKPRKLREKLAKEAGDPDDEPNSAAAEGAPRRPRGTAVHAIVPNPDGGATKLQPESKRRQVFETITAWYAESGQPVKVAELTEALGYEARPFVAKLIFRQHVIPAQLTEEPAGEAGSGEGGAAVS